MYKKETPTDLDNGLDHFRKTVNGKWKLIIIYYISIGYRRPGELLRAIPNAGKLVLARQLKELASHGIIIKSKRKYKFSEVEYSLTRLGLNFLPLIIDIELWGENQQGKVEEPQKIDYSLKNADEKSS